MLIDSQQSFALNGLEVRFERRGNGPALVLVHGLLGYSFSWRRVLEPLSQEREVFALDMPGSGFSQCLANTDAHLSAAAERLLTFLDEIGIAACDLVGSSYGGTTALYLAATHPERIRTLTLVSPANPWSRIGRKRIALLGWPLAGLLFPSFARYIPALHRFSIRRRAPPDIGLFILDRTRPSRLRLGAMVLTRSRPIHRSSLWCNFPIKF